MKQSRRQSDARTRRQRLCLEQLESRLTLSGAPFMESQLSGGERNDTFDSSSRLMQTNDASHSIRSNNVKDASHLVGSNNERKGTTNLRSNPARSDSAQQSKEAHRSDNQLRSAREPMAGQVTTESITRPPLTSAAPIGSGSLVAAQARIPASPPSTTSMGSDPPVPSSHSTPLADAMSVAVVSVRQSGDASVGASIPTPADAIRSVASDSPLPNSADKGPSQSNVAWTTVAFPPSAAFAWWGAHDDDDGDDDATDSEASGALDAETDRFGGEIEFESMPLLRETLPLVGRQSMTNDANVDAEPDEDSDSEDSTLLTLEFQHRLNAEEATVESLSIQAETDVPNARSLSSAHADQIDFVFEDDESAEEFGGLIDVPQQTMAVAVVKDELPYDAMIGINALHVDVILGQAPLLELNDEHLQDAEPVADPVSMDTHPITPTTAAITLLAATAHDRRNLARRGPTRKSRSEFIPE